MKYYTTWKIGGRVLALVDILNNSIVPSFFLKLKAEECLWRMLGKGSNILVSDEGYPGVVVRLAGEYLEIKPIGEYEIESGAGVPLSNMVSYTLQLGLGGYEFLVGVPGTVGGAIQVNAGCFGQEIGRLVQRVLVMDQNGKIDWLARDDFDFYYRGSSLKMSDLVILKVVFRLFPEKTEIIRKNIRHYSVLRKQCQPVGWPSAGCVLKNPPGEYASRIIEQMGFKGLRTGHAQISQKHSNFIVNLGNATAREVLALMDWVRHEIQRERNIILENEIEVWQ
jgi:UDP-N-acetylmuramate dehydrogenase